MEKLLEILKTYNEAITEDMDKKLVTDGIIDSVDIVSLIADLEDAFGISVPMEDIIEDNFDSASAMLAMINRLKAN